MRYTIWSELLQMVEAAIKSPRVSREIAVARFLNATVTLLASKPASELALSDIAETAGLSHRYVYRFFGTRLDLLVEVSDLLAVAITDSIQASLSHQRLRPEMVTDACRQPGDTRVHLVSYLISQGVDVKRFHAGSQQIRESMSDAFQQCGMSPEQARANTIKVLAFYYAEIFLLPTMALHENDIEDLALLIHAENEVACELLK